MECKQLKKRKIFLIKIILLWNANSMEYFELSSYPRIQPIKLTLYGLFALITCTYFFLNQILKNCKMLLFMLIINKLCSQTCYSKLFFQDWVDLFGLAYKCQIWQLGPSSYCSKSINFLILQTGFGIIIFLTTSGWKFKIVELSNLVEYDVGRSIVLFMFCLVCDWWSGIPSWSWRWGGWRSGCPALRHVAQDTVRVVSQKLSNIFLLFY